MTDVVIAKLDAYLEIEGLGEYEISSVVTNWGVNEIPMAECSLAVGRLAGEEQIRSLVHETLEDMRTMLRCSVYFSATGDYAPGQSWPSGYTRIFDGYLTGVGYRRSEGQMQYVVSIIHWLADLHFSSVLSAQSHPRTASDYTYRAVFQSLLADQAGFAGLGGGPVLISQLRAHRMFAADRLVEDFWGRSLKAFFVEIANEEHLNVTGELIDLVNLNGKNDAALAALARMEGVGGNEQDLELSDYTPPLSLSTVRDGSLAAQVAMSIAEFIGRATGETLARQTIWDVLVGSLAPAFMFGVIPLVEKALVVPRVQGLREAYTNKVSSSDFNFLDFSSYIPRPLRAMVVEAALQSDTAFAGLGNANVPAAIGVGGYFAPDSVPNGKGMIRFIGLPPWLNNIPSSGAGAGRTTGVNGQRPIATATTPKDEDDEEIRNSRFGQTHNGAWEGSADLFNRYARAMYIAEALRGRSGQLVGKLRFDIAPGSTILIEGRSEQFLGDEDQLGRTVIGEAARVSVGINCESSRAGTSMTLLNLRGESENEDDATSIESHPLYSTVFKGAPLLDKFSFSS